MSWHFGFKTDSESRSSHLRYVGIGFFFWRWGIFVGVWRDA